MGKVPGPLPSIHSPGLARWRVVGDNRRQEPEPTRRAARLCRFVCTDGGTIHTDREPARAHGQICAQRPPCLWAVATARTPRPVEGFTILRGESERRNAWLKWRASPDATGYVVYAGIDPNKLYTSVMVYGANEYYFRALDRDRRYFFEIEAFNENGISDRSAVKTVE